MKLLRSSALTLALAYLALGLIALASFAAPLWYSWHGMLDHAMTEVLQTDAQRLSEVYRREGVAGLSGYINARVAHPVLSGDHLLLFADSNLKPIAGNVSAWPASVPATAGNYTVSMPIAGQPSKVAVMVAPLPDGHRLLVSRDTTRWLPLERRFWFALGGAVAMLCVFGILGGVLIRRELMTRVQTVQQTISAIMQGDLTHRLPTLSSGDELNTLSQTINRMLAQIEQLVHGVRNVSNAIAHDLRTPLAELRARLEELSLTRPTSERTFAEIDGAVADVDRVIGIFNALLRLAEIDSGMRRSGFVAVDMAEVAAAAVEFYQPAAELSGSRLQLVQQGPAPVRGDRVLLAQALSNLIDNALKYTPANGDIVVSVRRRPDQMVQVTVADSGPGIAATDRLKVIERFYRGDASRGTPGVGLGLSVVDAVARLHGTILRLEDNRPGLRASFALMQDTRPVAQARKEPQQEAEVHHEPVYL
jgi:signal transduction histidine kinase